VVISISNYIGADGWLQEAKYPERRREDGNVLLQDMGFDYVRLLTDGEVTKNNLETIMLDEIRTTVGANDRFVFYWSGHGDQLVRSDTNTPFGFLPLQESKLRVGTAKRRRK
jgi:hypothetical protein